MDQSFVFAFDEFIVSVVITVGALSLVTGDCSAFRRYQSLSFQEGDRSSNSCKLRSQFKKFLSAKFK